MIQLTSVKKQAPDRYVVTVQDTNKATIDPDTQETAYQSYSVTYNPATGKEHLKAKLEELLAKDVAVETDEDQVMQDIKTTIEAIDTAKL